jgi:hypothetical protein
VNGFLSGIVNNVRDASAMASVTRKAASGQEVCRRDTYRKLYHRRAVSALGRAWRTKTIHLLITKLVATRRFELAQSPAPARSSGYFGRGVIDRADQLSRCMPAVQACPSVSKHLPIGGRMFGLSRTERRRQSSALGGAA